MNVWTLALAYARARPFGTALNVALLALGIATIVVLVLALRQFEAGLARDARGVDLVVGAKGSPLQLVLSSVYQADVPTGNISLTAADEVARHPMVARAIPLALGDAYRGFRIVGTTPDFLELRRAAMEKGRLWEAPLEAVLGAGVAAATGLDLDDTFVGSHGIAGEGLMHDEHPYRVVGLLARTGGVADRLVLTSVESVWEVHDAHPFHEAEADSGSRMKHDDGDGHHDDEHDHDTEDENPHGASPEGDPDREVTALLIQYRSPAVAIALPRWINDRSSLQAASPAFEIARMFQLLGVGLDTVRGFGFLLVAMAALGILVSQYAALDERRFDLAMMRSLGATRGRVFRFMIAEGVLLAAAGTALGVVLGHGAAVALGAALPPAALVGVGGLDWAPEEVWVVALGLGVGVLASLLPALAVYRQDVAAVLTDTAS